MHSLVSYHLQNSPPNWLDAIAKLRDGSVVKIVEGAERARDIMAINDTLLPWYRHVNDAQNIPVGGNYYAEAQRYFAMYVDDTFKSDRVAPYIRLLQEPFNEYHNNGHSADERRHWERWTEACAQVWNDYRTNDARLSHIRLVLGGAGVGNDLTLDNARVAVKYDCILDSHSYTPVAYGHIMPDFGTHPDGGEINCWKFFDGRFSYLDELFVANGYRVDWALGEGGVVRDGAPWWGALQPLDGWRHKYSCDGDYACFQRVVERWLDRAVQTRAYKEGRLLGMTLFTSGAPGAQWSEFETKQPEMNDIADLVSNYDYPPTGEIPVTDWQQEMWDKSIELQTVSLNKDAALQVAWLADGFQQVESEFWFTPSDGIQRAGQAAEHPGTGERRVYYAVVPDWNNIQWFNEPVPVGVVIDVSHWQG